MPSLPLPRSQALALAALLIGALVLGGRLLLRSEPRAASPRSGAPLVAAPPPRLVVHVVGAVRRPGLYRLEDGARIADALARAGGTTAKADVQLVNLAAPLADGQQVVVPARAARAAAEVDPAAAPSAGPAPGPVHLNTATLEQLDALPGVGPVTAQKILDYRTEHGAFSSIDDLDAIPGIGPSRLEDLRGLVAP
jgi:competence protein ComEA